MEVQFRKESVASLKTVLQDVRNCEETLEIKLPEGMPDIGRILSAWGQPVLRSKQWRDGEIQLSGGMTVWILYVPEGEEQCRCLQGWIPFQMDWELPEETAEGTIRASLLTRFVDARAVSARKTMIRAGLSAVVQAFCPTQTEVFLPQQKEDGIEWLVHTYPMRLPKEAGEKTFSLDEDLTLPASAPEGEKLLYYRLQPEVTDQKMLGNRLVFRGNGNLHILYLSEEGRLQSWDFDLPFSQFAELQEIHSSDAQADIRFCPTNVEVELDTEGQIHLRSGLVAQYVVEDVQVLTLAEDAYAPGRDMKLQVDSLELPAILDCRKESISGQQTIPVGGGYVVDLQFLPDYPRQRISQNGVRLEVPGTVQLLHYREDGSLQGTTLRWEGSQELRANGDTTTVAMPLVPKSQILPDGATVQLEVPMKLTFLGSQGVPMITGGELGDETQPDNKRPSLILKRAGEDDLWDIAKVSGSTRSAIRAANGLENDPVPGQMLIIPICG